MGDSVFGNLQISYLLEIFPAQCFWSSLFLLGQLVVGEVVFFGIPLFVGDFADFLQQGEIMA